MTHFLTTVLVTEKLEMHSQNAKLWLKEPICCVDVLNYVQSSELFSFSVSLHDSLLPVTYCFYRVTHRSSTNVLNTDRTTDLYINTVDRTIEQLRTRLLRTLQWRPVVLNVRTHCSILQPVTATIEVNRIKMITISDYSIYNKHVCSTFYAPPGIERTKVLEKVFRFLGF